MTANTIEMNQSRQVLDEYEEIWLFGYGSLIYKVDFPYLEKSPAYISGWTRRFWQGSHDHRGTPEQPGRVVTLIPEVNALCHGMAYRVTAEEFVYLDYREKNGYLRHEVPMILTQNNGVPIKKTGLIYIADEHNEAFLGEASEKIIAEHIANSRGPSGENSEYLLSLAQALRDLNVKDGHIFEIENHLLKRNT
jgi:cation transport regulator ChaC